MEIRAAHNFRTRFSGAILEVFRNSKWVMRHIVRKALRRPTFQRYKVCTNRSSDEGVMAPGSRGVGAVFVHFSDANIPVKRGMLSANREFHVVAGVIHLSNAPGPADQLVASRKDSVREGGLLRCLLLQGSRFMGIRAWVREIWFREQRPRGVFGPFEGSFPIGIPASPGKILAIREFHVMHECVFFPTCPGSRINFVASQEDSVRKRGNVGGKIPELSAKPYFVGLFSRAWPCTEASLGSQDMILRTEAVGMFLMPRGHLLTEIPA
uniref:Uncharacterized protein n=1 Tax=Fagus sylvatica TaxID=28930 RepID=A0A2N9GNF7_FAGSY